MRKLALAMVARPDLTLVNPAVEETDTPPVRWRPTPEELGSLRRVIRTLLAEADRDGRLSGLYRRLAEALRRWFLRGPGPPPQ